MNHGDIPLSKEIVVADNKNTNMTPINEYPNYYFLLTDILTFKSALKQQNLIKIQCESHIKFKFLSSHSFKKLLKSEINLVIYFLVLIIIKYYFT